MDRRLGGLLTALQVSVWLLVGWAAGLGWAYVWGPWIFPEPQPTGIWEVEYEQGWWRFSRGCALGESQMECFERLWHTRLCGPGEDR